MAFANSYYARSNVNPNANSFHLLLLRLSIAIPSKDGKLSDYIHRLQPPHSISYWWDDGYGWITGKITKGLTKKVTSTIIKWEVTVKFDREGDVHTLKFHPLEKRWKIRRRDESGGNDEETSSNVNNNKSATPSSKKAAKPSSVKKVKKSKTIKDISVESSKPEGITVDKKEAKKAAPSSKQQSLLPPKTLTSEPEQQQEQQQSMKKSPPTCSKAAAAAATKTICATAKSKAPSQAAHHNQQSQQQQTENWTSSDEEIAAELNSQSIAFAVSKWNPRQEDKPASTVASSVTTNPNPPCPKTMYDTQTLKPKHTTASTRPKTIFDIPTLKPKSTTACKKRIVTSVTAASATNTTTASSAAKYKGRNPQHIEKSVASIKSPNAGPVIANTATAVSTGENTKFMQHLYKKECVKATKFVGEVINNNNNDHLKDEEVLSTEVGEMEFKIDEA